MPWAGVGQRIRNEVRDDLFDARAVRFDVNGRRLDRDGMGARFARRAQRVDRALRSRSELERLALKIDLAGDDLTDVEQIVEQMDEPAASGAR